MLTGSRRHGRAGFPRAPKANDVWPPSFAKIQPDYLQRANARVDVTEETILGEAKAPGHHLCK